MKHLLIILSFLLLPISVYGFDWTVQYDMKKSDGSYEFVELSVPNIGGSNVTNWELPNQVGSWKCLLNGYNTTIGEHRNSSMSLQCHLKGDETNILTSTIDCNNRGRENNELSILYPKSIKNNKGVPYPDTGITLKCKL